MGVVTIQDRKVVIKEHKMRSIWKGIKYQLMPSRGFRSWKNAHLLRCQIPTPMPFGYVEKRIAPWKKHSYYVYEYLEGLDLYTLLERAISLDNSIVEECVGLICLLEKHRILCRDLKAPNIVISRGVAWLIDIHSVRQSSFRFAAYHRRNIARFLYSLRRFDGARESFIDCFQRHGVSIDTHMLSKEFAAE